MKKLRNKGQLYKYTAICIFSSITITAIAQEKERDTTNLAQVRVVAEDPKRVFKNVPGTVNIISNKEIKEIAPISAGD